MPKLPHPDAIADCVLAAFGALPAKFKPRALPHGNREWVPLAGVVMSRDIGWHGMVAATPTPTLERRGTTSTTTDNLCAQADDKEVENAQHGDASSNTLAEPQLLCAALATGMKCLPRDKIQHANGSVLHDWHAEVLALRGFNRWLVDQCAALARTRHRRGSTSLDEPDDSSWVRWRRDGKMGTAAFELGRGVHLHMYCSACPCGDASMELTMAAQADATPWPTPSTAASSDDEEAGLPGRGYFSRLGIVRRKPSRPDAPTTWSKSCTDKLAMKQFTGVLSALTSLLIQADGRTWLRSFIIPETELVASAVARAWGPMGRLCHASLPVMEAEDQGYGYRPFEVRMTSRVFEFAKSAEAASGSNLSALFVAPALVSSSDLGISCEPRLEVLINGVLQGRKQFDPEGRGASSVSRRRMWETVQDIHATMKGSCYGESGAEAGTRMTYEQMRAGSETGDRAEVKRFVRATVLKGWKRNEGDESWAMQIKAKPE